MPVLVRLLFNALFPPFSRKIVSQSLFCYLTKEQPRTTRARKHAKASAHLAEKNGDEKFRSKEKLGQIPEYAGGHSRRYIPHSSCADRNLISPRLHKYSVGCGRAVFKIKSGVMAFSLLWPPATDGRPFILTRAKLTLPSARVLNRDRRGIFSGRAVLFCNGRIT